MLIMLASILSWQSVSVDVDDVSDGEGDGEERLGINVHCVGLTFNKHCRLNELKTLGLVFFFKPAIFVSSE